MNPVMENLLTRRSVRKFTAQRISREALAAILKAGIYAPSGMNMQTMRLTAVTDREKIQRLAEITGRKLGRCDYDFYKPDVLVIPTNERESRWGMEDNACAMENMFLAAHSLGIGSVWINQLREVCDDEEVRSLLREWGIPDGHTVYGAAALGYAADGAVCENPKKVSVINIVE